MPILIDVFFKAAFFPVIHRGMFEKQLNDGFHKRNGTFLRIVLLICATGARWCDDPRVLDRRWPVPLSAGYQWFKQLSYGEKSFAEDTKLEDAQLQVVCFTELPCFAADDSDSSSSSIALVHPAITRDGLYPV
jgi:hypothetical protein